MKIGCPAAHDVGAVVGHAVSSVSRQQAGQGRSGPTIRGAPGMLDNRVSMASGTVSPVLLSVVLVVRRHQAWVRPCLRSILDQAPRRPRRGRVVDDALDRTTRRASSRRSPHGDPRVRMHRSETRRSAPPAALETGRELARGDYVWLVDAADLLLPGAFAAVTAGLASTPDVLLVGEVERDVYGKDRRPTAARAAGRSCATGSSAGSTSLGIDLRPGAHLDESRLASAVFAARRHRGAGRHPGPRAPHPSRPRRPAVDRWRPVVRRAPARRRGTRDEARRLARNARPRPPGARGRHGRGCRRGPEAGHLRKAVREARYAAELRRPLDPALAVFAAYWGAAYSCNPRAIYEKARELAPWLRGVWVVKRRLRARPARRASSTSWRAPASTTG